MVQKGLSDSVADDIMAMIAIEKRFLPGDKLPNELAEEPGVGITTLVAEIDYNLEGINKIAARIPYLAKIMPASDISMNDINKAGGVSAIINELTKIPNAIHPDR